MAAPVGYQTFCPVGAALNVVGERWTLLIVRDLFLGPRRYSELLKGLGGIPTDILAARLRTLREQGIVRQVGTGRAQRYELTESGQALGPVLRELGRWGADRLVLPADPSEIPTRVPLTSLLLGGAPIRAQATGEYEVRVEDGNRPSRDRAASQIHAAPDSEPDTTIDLTRCRNEGDSFSARAPPKSNKPATSRSRASRRRAQAFLNTLTGPPRLAAIRQQLEVAAGDA